MLLKTASDMIGLWFYLAVMGLSLEPQKTR